MRAVCAREAGRQAETRTPCKRRGIAITSSRWRRRRNPKLTRCASRPSGCGAWRRSTRTCAPRWSGASWHAASRRRSSALRGAATLLVDAWTSLRGPGVVRAEPGTSRKRKRQRRSARTRSTRREALAYLSGRLSRGQARCYRAEPGDPRGSSGTSSGIATLAQQSRCIGSEPGGLCSGPDAVRGEPRDPAGIGRPVGYRHRAQATSAVSPARRVTMPVARSRCTRRAWPSSGSWAIDRVIAKSLESLASFGA